MWRCLLCLLLLLLASCAAFAGVVIAPNNASGTDGSISFSLGSDTFQPGSVGLRIQELFGSGQFPQTPILITAMWFRQDLNSAPIDVLFSNFTVTLSVTQEYPIDSTGSGRTYMGDTFSANIGIGSTTVYSGSKEFVGVSSCVTSCPFDFGMKIVFSTPFLYDARTGRLLADIDMSPPVYENQISGVALDGVQSQVFPQPNSPVSTVYASIADWNNQPATGTLLDGGLVTEFEYQTPEPSSWMALLSGVGMLLGLRRRRR